MSFMMHHHSTAEIVFGLFFFFPLPVCLFMDGWVVVMSMHTLTHDCDVSLFIGCEYDILCLVKTGEEICG
jgi:hypothetical protein